MEWTEDRVAELRRLWAEGKSASQIAEIMGGVTRNAVIGKAHRLALDGRPSPIKRDPTQPRPPNRPRKPVEVPRQGASVLDLTERMCRWPLGHPGEPGFHFCGDRTVQQGLPYCQTHAAVAYHTPARRDSSGGGERERERDRSAEWLKVMARG